AALHRVEVRAMRLVRRHVSGGRDLARAASRPDPGGAPAAALERSRDVQLRALRQAARHPEDHRQHAGKAGRSFDVRRTGTAGSAQDVRRLPRDRHDGEGAAGRTTCRAGGRRMTEAATSMAMRGPLPTEDQARADFYALLGRLFAAAPDASLLRAIAQ